MQVGVVGDYINIHEMIGIVCVDSIICYIIIFLITKVFA
jgi:hypothetical protein